MKRGRPRLALVPRPSHSAATPRLPPDTWHEVQAHYSSEVIFEGVFNSDVIGLTIFDLATLQTVRANDYMLRLIGATRAEFENGSRCCYKATPPEWRWLDDHAVAQARSEGRWEAFEKEYERPDGSRVPVRVSSAPLANASQLIVVCVEDLSERKSAEERVRLLQSEVNHLSRLTAMGTMASILAHEVAQPMLAVSNALAALSQIKSDGAELTDIRAERALELATRQSARAVQLLQRIRRFAAPDKGACEPLDVRDAIEDAAALALLRHPDVELQITTSSRAARVLGDAIQVEQVLVNLIRNAAEAMDGRGRIEVTARRVSEHVEVAVHDSGPGFGKLAEHAFQAFTTSKPDGTGLGLTICREIIEGMGGRIRIDNTAEGGLVLFTLPRYR